MRNHLCGNEIPCCGSCPGSALSKPKLWPCFSNVKCQPGQQKLEADPARGGFLVRATHSGAGIRIPTCFGSGRCKTGEEGKFPLHKLCLGRSAVRLPVVPVSPGKDMFYSTKSFSSSRQTPTFHRPWCRDFPRIPGTTGWFSTDVIRQNVVTSFENYLLA